MKSEETEGYIRSAFHLFSQGNDTCCDLEMVRNMIQNLNMNPMEKQLKDLVSEMLDIEIVEEKSESEELFADEIGMGQAEDENSDLSNIDKAAEPDERVASEDSKDGEGEFCIHISQFSNVMERVISESEIPRDNLNKIKRAFMSLDQNKSGQLHINYLIEILRSEGEAFSEFECDRLRRKLQGYGTTRFSYEEVVEELALH